MTRPEKEEDENDPTTWTHFVIYAKVEDADVFMKVQEEFGISPFLESFILVINITDVNFMMITFGDEGDPSSTSFDWTMLSAETQKALINWNAANKINLARRGYNYLTPFDYNIDEIKLKKIIQPLEQETDYLNTTSYINPYLSLFGGERVGIPIKRHFGFNFGIGNKYSGPFESDQISMGLNFYGISFNYQTRLSGLNTRSNIPKNNENSFWAEYNNIYSPANLWEINYNLPVLNVITVGFMTEFGDSTEKAFNPHNYYENNDSTKQMANNLISGRYFNAEFRFPLRLFEAERSFIYAAYYAKEVNIGVILRNGKIGKTAFDFRTNFTISEIRNFQFLAECLFSALGSENGFDSFAIGPSFRFTKLKNGNFGIHTFFLNARFTLGRNLNY